MNKSRRINELARDLEVKSSAILDKLKELGISGKTHSSSVDEDVVVQLRHVFLGEDLPAGTTLGRSSGTNGASHQTPRGHPGRAAEGKKKPRAGRPLTRTPAPQPNHPA